MLVFVPNMDKSVERWSAIKQAFPEEDLIRISGYNGYEWESGATDDKGIPLFKNEARSFLIEAGFLEESWYPVHPGELAVALGHASIWQEIVDTDLDCAIVLEDDVAPTESLTGRIEDSIKFPSDADVLFLTGEDQGFDFDGEFSLPCNQLDELGRLQVAYGAHGYVISNRGARRALEATLPLHNHFPQQWWIQAFKGFAMARTGCALQENSGYAYGLKKGLVRQSPSAKKSLVTKSGKKPWRILRRAV